MTNCRTDVCRSNSLGRVCPTPYHIEGRDSSRSAHAPGLSRLEDGSDKPGASPNFWSWDSAIIKLNRFGDPVERQTEGAWDQMEARNLKTPQRQDRVQVRQARTARYAP
jgi:hypothetical protein